MISHGLGMKWTWKIPNMHVFFEKYQFVQICDVVYLYTVCGRNKNGSLLEVIFLPLALCHASLFLPCSLLPILWFSEIIASSPSSNLAKIGRDSGLLSQQS